MEIMASGPITSGQIDGEKQKQWQILFSWAPESLQTVTATVKLRHLLFGRKAITNWDNILKSRDITLPAKVHIIKAMIFPVVMNRYKSWAIKKAEYRKTWCFQIVVLEETLESPLDNKEIKPINPKGNQPWIFIGRTDAEAEIQYFGHLMQRTDSLEKTLVLGKIEGKKRMGRQDEMVGWHHRLDDEIEQALGAGDGQGSLACCSPWGRKESDITEWLTLSLHSVCMSMLL